MPLRLGMFEVRAPSFFFRSPLPFKPGRTLACFWTVDRKVRLQNGTNRLKLGLVNSSWSTKVSARIRGLHLQIEIFVWEETREMDELIQVLQPHPEDRLHLRLHRARSVVLTAQEYVLFSYLFFYAWWISPSSFRVPLSQIHPNKPTNLHFS